MNSKMIKSLGKLGIDVHDIKYSYANSMNEFGFAEEDPYITFVLKGTFNDEEEMKELAEHLVILKMMNGNEHTAVKDLYEQLKTAAGLTHE